MKTYSLKLLYSTLITTSLLSGCELLQKQTPAPSRQVTQSVESNNEKVSIRQVIRLLEVGKLTQAKMLLADMLKKSPSSQTLMRLRSVISDDPKKVYGSNYYEYKVKPGETLGAIAERKLGKSWEFYGLARYNGIKDPRNLRAGQRLKIPESKSTKLPSHNTKVSRDILEEVRILIEKQEFINAGRLTVTSRSLYNKQTESKKLLKLALNKHADQFNAIVEMSRARQEAQNLQEENVHRFLAQPLQRAIQYFDWKINLKKGAVALSENSTKQAYLAYKEAAALNFAPSSDQLRLKESISEIYHRDAVIKFRNQQLDDAVDLWTKIIEIDPEHQSAKTFRERAIKLIEQLKSIN